MNDWEVEAARKAELARVAMATARRYPHLSLAAIARLFGVGMTDVWNALAPVGIERPRRNAGDELTRQNVATDVASGLSVAAMARKYDVTEHMIRRMVAPPVAPAVLAAVADQCLSQPDEVAPPPVPDQPQPTAPGPKDKRRRRPDEMPARERIVALLDQGAGRKRMERELNVSPSVLHRLLRHYGLLEQMAAVTAANQGYLSRAVLKQQIIGLLTDPDAREGTMVRCVQRGLSGQEVRSLLTRYGGMPADEHRYDVQLIIREVRL